MQYLKMLSLTYENPAFAEELAEDLIVKKQDEAELAAEVEIANNTVLIVQSIRHISTYLNKGIGWNMASLTLTRLERTTRPHGTRSKKTGR